MKRGFLFTFGLLLIFGLLASVVVAQRAAPIRLDAPKDCGDCKPTDTPQPGAHPGDEDGDGIPDGIDQCPNNGGPSSNVGCPPGKQPPAASDSRASPVPPPVILPTLPTTGGCVLATQSDKGVNVRADPSLTAEIVGVLDPQTLYPVIAILNNAEGVWDRIAAGWVARRVVRLGGDCDTIPTVDEPGSSNSNPIALSDPNGFALTLDKGSHPGTDTPQGYCSSDFAVNWPTFDGSGKDGVHFDFGDVSRCIKLNSDGHGFALSPPDPCSPAPTCFNVAWFVGFNPDHQPLLVGLFAPPSETNPPDPDKTNVLLTWVFPPSTSTPDFTIRWALSDPPDPDKPGLTINWALGNPPEPDKPGITINWALSSPPDPDKPGLTINWALVNPPDPDKPGLTINEALGNPPDPDFQGFRVGDAGSAHAFIVVQFPLPTAH